MFPVMAAESQNIIHKNWVYITLCPTLRNSVFGASLQKRGQQRSSRAIFVQSPS